MSGIRTPPNSGQEYGRVLFQEFTEENDVEPTRLFDPSNTTGSISIRALNTNQGTVYLGWDEDVTPETGYPLHRGDALGIEIDASTQPLYAVSDANADDVRIISTN